MVRTKSCPRRNSSWQEAVPNLRDPNLTYMMLHHFENKGYREIMAYIQGRTKPIIIYGTKRNHIPDFKDRKNAKKADIGQLKI